MIKILSRGFLLLTIIVFLSSLTIMKVYSQDENTNIQDELEVKNILSGKIEILVPKSFMIMSEEMAKIKYPSEKRPTLIYTNEKGSINIAFNYTSNSITNDQIILFRDKMKELFSNLYPSAVWIEDKIEFINGKNVGVLELLTPAIDAKIYNLIFFTELEGKLLLCTFNCTEKEMVTWAKTAHQILKSIKEI